MLTKHKLLLVVVHFLLLIATHQAYVFASIGFQPSGDSSGNLEEKALDWKPRSPVPLHRFHMTFTLFFSPSSISLIADRPHYSSCLCSLMIFLSLSGSRLHYFFLSRCKFGTLLQLLTFPRFLVRKKENKSYFGKNRTHDFRTIKSGCAGYLLDHSGDEGSLHI